MGKTGKWFKSLFAGKRDGKFQTSNGVDVNHFPTREKRRWSFRGSVVSREEKGSMGVATVNAASGDSAAENDAKKHTLGVPPVMYSGQGCRMDVEEAAAVKIQSVFRAHLARKALNALRGLVKLQALVRGHLVRKQATVTLRCMQALITVQARARAHRLLMAAASESKQLDKKKYNNSRKFTTANRLQNPNHDYDKSLDEKIVEMDSGCYNPSTRAANSYSKHIVSERSDQRISAHRTSIKQDNSPAPSAIAELSPRTCSNHFEDYSFGTVQSSPQCYSAMSKPDLSKISFSYARSEYCDSLYNEYPFYPNYMSNTESSRAKVRSHSAPKCRPIDASDRQSSRRRPSLEGRSLPKAVKMQRSVSSSTQNYQFPCSVKIEKSVRDSDCGSTGTYRSVIGFEVQGDRF